jgi:phenylacetate-CoA ligase
MPSALGARKDLAFIKLFRVKILRVRNERSSKTQMGLDFRLKDFAYPLSILRLKREFERHQWGSAELLRDYQLARLKATVAHSYQNVSFYRRMFDERGLNPNDIRSISDIRFLPLLTKEMVRLNSDSLVAHDAPRYSPTSIKTSGTSGSQLHFLMDKNSNVLEFVFYWRFWAWAGYRLGDRFAELSAQHFTPSGRGPRNGIADYSPLTRRVMVNSLLISLAHRDEYISLFKQFKPRFLKGLPSNLYMLALIFGSKNTHGVALQAVFSQGENLTALQRHVIEETFRCKVFDHYGHMERTVAITQCEQGTYHVHEDYGLLELLEPSSIPEDGDAETESMREIVGTGLHNCAMPLLRYRTGDLVRVKQAGHRCKCGRTFACIENIVGRSSDVVITPDKRAITALYVALDRTAGLDMGQIVQDGIDHLTLRLALSETADAKAVTAVLLQNVREFVGDRMRLDVEMLTADEIRGDRRTKFKSIVSHIKPEELLH